MVAHELRVLVVADVNDDDTGFVGQRIAQSGGVLEPVDRDDIPSWESTCTPVQPHLILLMGSKRSGADPEQASVVAAETALVGGALANGTPVLGICYGAQLLAHALGGRIRHSDRPEFA